jgi:predicted nuclease of predicted toxin-antitoxin system
LKLRFDQNLSHRLPLRLSDLFPDSKHIRLLGMDRTSDTAGSDYATQNGFVIVTQDADFAERSLLFGPPPKIVWLRCGNSTPKNIEAILRENSARILELDDCSSGPFIEIF